MSNPNMGNSVTNKAARQASTSVGEMATIRVCWRVRSRLVLTPLWLMSAFTSSICSIASGFQTAADQTDALMSPAKAFVETYCVDCHGSEAQEGDRRFDTLLPGGETNEAEPNSTLKTREQWREILDRLNLGDMPPEDAEQPSDDERLAIIESLTQFLSQKTSDESSSAVALRRLNRAEYDRSVRSLLGLESLLADPTDSFPPDETNHGFSNVADSLVISDVLMKSYLKASDRYLNAVIDQAATKKTASKSQQWRFKPPFYREWNVGDGLNRPGEYQHIRESYGGYGYFLWLEQFREGVPAAGRYQIRVKATAINREHPYLSQILAVAKEDPLVMSIVAGDAALTKEPSEDHATDRVVASFELSDDDPQWYTADVWLDKGYLIKLGYPNGPRRIKYMRHWLMREHRDSFPQFIDKYVHIFHTMHPDYDPETGPALAEKFLEEQEVLKQAGQPYALYGIDQSIHMDDAWRTFYSEYQGPRIRVFDIELAGPKAVEPAMVAKPLVDNDCSDEEAKAAIREFATRAARRPLAASELAPLIELFEKQRQQEHSVRDAARLVYKAVLCGPDFLYHRTRGGKLDDYELASRLSFFLSGGPPDQELLALAAEGKLAKPAVRQQQARRLLAQETRVEFIERFADAWLKLGKLGTALPDMVEHPRYFNELLEPAMRKQTTLFLENAILENKPAKWLIDSDHTFLNAPLARHYGLEHLADFRGREFRQVKLGESKAERLRGGLLGQASILTASANGIDTSPVVRGVWVLESLLGTPPSPPPPDIEPIEPDIRGTATIRDQLAKHRDVASCRHCHQRIDPLGFALESFDEIGKFREVYRVAQKSLPIDTSGQLPSGEGFEDLLGLKQLLKKQVRLIEQNLIRKLLVFATGRMEDGNDEADVLVLMQALTKQGKPGPGLQDFVLGVVASEAFER